MQRQLSVNTKTVAQFIDEIKLGSEIILDIRPVKNEEYKICSL